MPSWVRLPPIDEHAAMAANALPAVVVEGNRSSPLVINCSLSTSNISRNDMSGENAAYFIFHQTALVVCVFLPPDFKVEVILWFISYEFEDLKI